MFPSPTATWLGSEARCRVTWSDLGSVQNMHVEVTGRPPNHEFTLFVVQHNTAPWPEVVSDGPRNQQEGSRNLRRHGDLQPREVHWERHGQYRWRISEFGSQIATMPKRPTARSTRSFDGDHQDGILVLSTGTFADDNGPPLHLKEVIATGSRH
jgi:hypothetical protein